jgi:CRISPR-associated endonuclease/helicase Cas3
MRTIKDSSKYDTESMETPDVINRFEKWFNDITGFPRFHWQYRLFIQLINGNIPSALGLPTGLGKTSVMVLWLLARAFNTSLPRRLVYVVDRRAVVDQATEAAETIREVLQAKSELGDLQERLGLKGKPLPVSTLRGKFVDNREWLADPTVPAIIVGTVDMIGSRLLFEGYGVSRGMRRYHAGLLGADTLFVLDESHLCPPFEALLHTIANDNRPALRGEQKLEIIPPFHFLPLSATGKNTDNNTFCLISPDHKDDEVTKRLTAKKQISYVTLDDKATLVQRLADKAWEMRSSREEEHPEKFNRVLIFCDRREDAKKVADDLEKRMKKAKFPDDCVNLLVGARRIRERQELNEWLEQKGFIAGSSEKQEIPVFLVATSAGEVGIDLDADHMVCDLTAFERMVQRFGRVNRRGRGEAHIVIFGVEPKKPKEERPQKPQEQSLIMPEKPEKPGRSAEKSIIEVYNAEKKKFDKDQKEYTKRKKEYEQKLKNYPQELAKYRDAWRSYRVFTAQKLIMEVLKGDASPSAIVSLQEKAKTNKRIEILLRHAVSAEPLRPALSRALVDAWSMTSLETHPGRPEIEPWLRGWIDKEEPESTVAWRHFLPWRDGEKQPNPNEVNAFFEAAPIHLSETLTASTSEIAEVLTKRAAEFLKKTDSTSEEAGESPGVLLFNQVGKLQKALRIKDLTATDKKELRQGLQRKQIVVSGVLGGLNPAGLLDGSIDDMPTTLDHEWPEIDLKETIGYRISRTDKVENGNSDWRISYTFPLSDSEEEDEQKSLMVEVFRGGNASRQGDPAISRFEQSLSEHHEWAGKAAEGIADALGLSEKMKAALIAAAQGHDWGKKRGLWQDSMNAPKNDQPYAKTLGGGNPRLLGGYRHEFGSLGDVKDDPAINALEPELKELALHLIASHHGYASPFIPAIDPDVPPSVLALRAQEVALRFASLQQRWGPWGLAWLEAIFRAADHRASRKLDEQPKKENK